MRALRAALAAAVLPWVSWACLSGCSTAEADSASDACEVIVEECHMGSSLSECIDEVGSMDPDCIDCIAQHGCDYATCQRLPVGCRLPLNLMGSK